MIITLCGFMGAGKSTIGKKIAQALHCAFIDLDLYIEQKHDLPVTELFTRYGEGFFREEERKALEEIVSAGNTSVPEKKCRQSSGETDSLASGELMETSLPVTAVLALGGGTAAVPACARIIREKTCCLYLHCEPETLIGRLARNRDKRPLLAGKSEKELETYIRTTMLRREPFYLQCSRAVVENDAENPEIILSSCIERIRHLLP